MAGNDYRSGRRQVSFVVDESLWAAVKGVAAGRGWSVTRLVTELLEREVGYGDVGTGPADSARVGASGGFVGSQRGGDRGGDSVSGASGRVEPLTERNAAAAGVNWDAIVAAGKYRKNYLDVENSYTGVDTPIDPIEEIA